MQGVSYEIVTIEGLEKDEQLTEQLGVFRSQCSNQLQNYSELNTKIETLRDSLIDLTNNLVNTDLTLTELENESHKDRHTSETALSKTYHVSYFLI